MNIVDIIILLIGAASVYYFFFTERPLMKKNRHDIESKKVVEVKMFSSSEIYKTEESKDWEYLKELITLEDYVYAKIPMVGKNKLYNIKMKEEDTEENEYLNVVIDEQLDNTLAEFESDGTYLFALYKSNPDYSEE